MTGHWLAERLTPVERRTLLAFAGAWGFGVVVGWLGLTDVLTAWSGDRLHPPLPSPAALAQKLPPGDPRVPLYVKGLALRRERERAAGEPVAIDPNAADRAAWDRLPGIGPQIAAAILEHRARHGPFRTPEDLLKVRGIGPVTLERLRPYLQWPDGETAPGGVGGGALAEARPSVNDVEVAFLERLDGIGPKLARSIVEERRRRRGFRAWPEILEIEGIGPAKLRVLQNATRLGEERPEAGTGPVRR